MSDPLPLNLDQIWIKEVGLPGGIESMLASKGFYVLGDLAAITHEELVQIPGVSVLTARRIQLKIDFVLELTDSLSMQTALRSGTITDPLGPALGSDFHDHLTRTGQDPAAVQISAIPMSNATTTLFRKARLGTFDQIAGLSNLDLIRLLRPRTPDLLDDLAFGVQTFIGRPVVAPVSPNAVDFGPETSGEPIRDAVALLRWALDKLPERSREVLALRFGMSGPTQTLEQIGQQLNVSRERIRQIESKAIARLSRNKRLLVPAVAQLDTLRATVGLDWADPRTLPYISATLAADQQHMLPLILALAPPPASIPVQDVDEAFVVVLAGNSPMSIEAFTAEVLDFLDPDELAANPAFSIETRLALPGPAELDGAGLVSLSTTAPLTPGIRRLMRLQTMRRILEEHGPSHYSFVATLLNEALPDDADMDAKQVRNWMDQRKGMFVWAGRGCYGLKSQDVGIRAEQQSDAIAPHARPWLSRRKGIGDEIAAFLMERGPASLKEIEDHILERFAVQPTSVGAAIKQDRMRRFEIDPNQHVSLREASLSQFMVEPVLV